MRTRILSQTDFTRPADGWCWPDEKVIEQAGVQRNGRGGGLPLRCGRDQGVHFNGQGVHTRNGDAIELHFQLMNAGRGAISFGYQGGMEWVKARLDFKRQLVSVEHSDWTRAQSLPTKFKLARQKVHVLRLEKSEGRGAHVGMANVCVCLDGQTLLRIDDLNVLPEIAVTLHVRDVEIVLHRFVHRGVPSQVPEYLHVGGWQVLNVADMDKNFSSICRGLGQAAEAGVRLLVTPETSLTGLFPTESVTRRSKPIADAERKLQRFIRRLPNAPYLVAGLPVWQRQDNHRRKKTRFNVSRIYDPDGHVILTGRKIHSCESDFWHGYRLNEFEVDGAPIAMHICHDGRYPEVWTLPVMFGARLVLHPSNGGSPKSTVDAFEVQNNQMTQSMHAFYLRVNGGGHSCLVSPQKYHNLVAVPPECRRDNPAFPMTGPAREGLFHAKIRLHDAFGYWPMRSFRASEEIARAYVKLYRAHGGRRCG